MSKGWSVLGLIVCSICIVPIYQKYDGDFFMTLFPFIGIILNGINIIDEMNKSK